MSKRNSRKEDWRRGCGSKTEAYLFGFKKLIERETNFFLRFGCFQYPGGFEAGFKFCSREYLETGAGQRSKPINVFSRAAARQSVSRKQLETAAE